MGINNRQRRAAKARKRARSRAHHRHSHSHTAGRPGDGHEGDPWSADNDCAWAHDSPFTSAEQVRSYVHAVAYDIARGDAIGAGQSIYLLSCTEPRLVHSAAEAELLAAVGRLWRNGWQPSELVRQARRVSARAGRLASLAVAVDHAVRAPATLHPRWSAQLDELTLPPVDSITGWIAGFAAAAALSDLELVRLVVELLAACFSVGPLPTIIPPPGATAASDAGSWPDTTPEGIDDAILRKIRALLAQGESTTFEAEAATFTAKAQQLMARHAIDAAVAWSKGERHERPITIRLPIDDPYAEVKSWLLGVVARHSRCRAVYHPAYLLSSVVGFAGDVAATEMLFTSLLVQSQIAVQAEGATTGPGGRTRSRSFRSSFLIAYVHRIDTRLAAINAAIEAEAEDSCVAPVGGVGGEGVLLPVLAERLHVVDEEVAEMFGNLTSGRVRGGDDWLGWERGILAADRARLNVADLTE